MALGILGAMGTVAASDAHLLVGELSLDGAIRPVRGALSIAACARKQKIANLLVPAENAPEAPRKATTRASGESARTHEASSRLVAMSRMLSGGRSIVIHAA